MSFDRNDNDGFGHSHPPVAMRQKEYQPGYTNVLIQAETKEDLRAFRLRELGSDTHVERCLVTAALELLIEDESLHDRWLDVFRSVVQVDMQLAFDYRRNRTR